jgi:Tfp pilus assembly protein PilN
LESNQKQLDELKAENLDTLVVAQQTSTEVENSIRWSQVVQQLLKVTPVNVFYRSYSASTDGKMTVSVITDSYSSAANLIAVLNKSTVFSNAFVASMARGSSDGGSQVVTFGITFDIDSSNL